MAVTSEHRRRPHDNRRRQAGRYVLGDLLGRGGMAEVFAGHSLGDHGFQKPVAIKRLLPELANDKVFVERLIHEAKLLVGMTHGNVVSVIDLARDGDDVFLVMDFVDGPSLRQLLKARNNEPVPLAIASYIVQAAAAGLEFAHSRPAGGAIIHADISPSNLLLTTSGEVRVADFGIARREGGEHGIVEGKWAYMAPEQARGEPLTPRSDVFALGVVLYELITGAHPFGRQVTAEERALGPLQVIRPRVVRPSIPPGLDAICMTALAHDPRERYARMQNMIDALMDERFTNQWREGAADLAKMIESNANGPAVPSLGHVSTSAYTLVTDHPVTLFTCSLIEVTPADPASSPRQQEPGSSLSVHGSQRDLSSVALGHAEPGLNSSVDTRASLSQRESASIIVAAQDASTFVPLPADQPEDAVAMANVLDPNARQPQFTFGGQHALVQHERMQQRTVASVHTSRSIAVDRKPRTTRWAFVVLGLATMLGVVAAVVLQMTPARSNKVSSTTPLIVQRESAKVIRPMRPVVTPLPSDEPDPRASTEAPPTEPAATITAPAQINDDLPSLTSLPSSATIVEKPAKSAPAKRTPVVASRRPPTAVAKQRPSIDDDKTPPIEKEKKPVAADVTGILMVRAYPSGFVAIDEGPRKNTPTGAIRLTPGKHRVKIYTAVASRIRDIVITENGLTIINVDWEADLVKVTQSD